MCKYLFAAKLAEWLGVHDHDYMHVFIVYQLGFVINLIGFKLYPSTHYKICFCQLLY